MISSDRETGGHPFSTLWFCITLKKHRLGLTSFSNYSIPASDDGQHIADFTVSLFIQQKGKRKELSTPRHVGTLSFAFLCKQKINKLDSKTAIGLHCSGTVFVHPHHDIGKGHKNFSSVRKIFFTNISYS